MQKISSTLGILYGLTLLTVAAIPLNGLSIELGATFKLANVFGILANLILILYLSPVVRKVQENIPKSFNFVFRILIILFLLTYLSNLVFLLERITPEAQAYFAKQFGSDGFSIFRTVLKPVQASIASAINFSWLLIPILVIKNNHQVIQLAWVYTISSSTQAVLGLIQFLFFLGTGINLFPIYRGGLVGESSYTQEAFLYLQGMKVVRVNALAGEPKYLAIIMGFGIAITCLFLVWESSGKNRIIAVTCFSIQLIALILTFSTLGYVLLAAGIFVYLCFTETNKFVLAFILVFALILVNSLFDIPLLAIDLFQERFLDRLGFEDMDQVYMLFIQDSPNYLFLGTGFGNFHLVSFKQASQLLLWNFGIVQPKLGILLILSTSGLVGLFIFSLIPFYLFKLLSSIKKDRDFPPSCKKFCTRIRNLIVYMIIVGVILRLTPFGLLWIGMGFAVAENNFMYLRHLKLLKFQHLNSVF